MGRDAWYWKHTKERGRGGGKESWKEKKQKCRERNTALNEPQTRVPFILRTLNTFMKLPEIFPLVKWETSTKLCLTLGTLWTIAARLLYPWIFQARILEWVAISFSMAWFLKTCLCCGSSLLVQWLRLHAPNEGGWVWSLVRELDPTYCN